MNADFERKLIAAEDARQVLFNINLLEEQADRAEREGRLQTADLLNQTAARMLERSRELLDIADGRRVVKANRPLSPVGQAVRFVYRLEDRPK